MTAWRRQRSHLAERPRPPQSYSLSSFSSLLSTTTMGVQFGSFDSICQTAALVICPLVGSDQGIEPNCYSRNVDVGGTLIFQPCESCALLARREHGEFSSNLELPSLAACLAFVSCWNWRCSQQTLENWLGLQDGRKRTHIVHLSATP